MANLIRKNDDLTGAVFFMLTVLRREPTRFPDGTRWDVWLCRCSCGKESVVRGYYLRAGRKKSCGCYAYTRNRHADGSSGLWLRYSIYRCGARARHLAWDLTQSQAKVLFDGNCHYCGCAPSQISQRWKRADKVQAEYSAYLYNGIDRVDNSRGYSSDNCVSCCGTCNIAKGKMSYARFKEWASTVARTFISAESSSVGGSYR